MKTLLSIFSFAKGNFIKILIVALVVAVSFGYLMYKTNIKLKIDNTRQSENYVQLNQANQVLSLKIDEYSDLHTKDSEKLDSLLQVIKLKPKQIKSATVINTIYKDTTIEKIVYLPVQKQTDSSYIIPITTDNGCWGLKGQILTKDPDSKFKVTERTANNSAQLVVTPQKRFLFWTIRKEKYQAFSDCGEVTFTQINFVK